MSSVPGDEIMVVRGYGACVETQNGWGLLDASAGRWHATVGDGRASIARAAALQMRVLETYHTSGVSGTNQRSPWQR